MARRKSSKITKTVDGAKARLDKVEGPSPNPMTNLILTDLVLRGGGQLMRHAVEASLLKTKYDKTKAKKIIAGRSLTQTLIATAVARFATRSVPGMILVGGVSLAAFARIVHLRDVHTRLRAAWHRRVGHAQRSKRQVVQALAAIGAADAGQGFGVGPLVDPRAAQWRQSARDVDLRRRVGVDARRVKQTQRRVGFTARFGTLCHQGVGQCDFAERHANVGPRAFNIDFGGAGKGGARDAAGKIVGVNGKAGFGQGLKSPERGWGLSGEPGIFGRVLVPKNVGPYAGMTPIRFSGSRIPLRN